MESLPKGVYRQQKRLADGTVRTYYRWRLTGKRIHGEPGSPEFAASLDRAKNAAASTNPAGSWGALIEMYRTSPDYRALKPKSRAYYDRHIASVKVWSSRPATDVRRSEVLTIRDAIAVHHPQAGNQFVKVMSVVMDFAVEREIRDFNPLIRLKRLPGGAHATWSDAQIKYALASFPEVMRRAIILALYTGQREGDCCAMTWAQYDGSAIEVVQEKTKESLWIPVHRVLKRELDAWRKEGERETILINSRGRPWPTDSFAAGIYRIIHQHTQLAGMVFHGLRKAAAARLAEAGCSTHEIASITGHRTLGMLELYTKKADQRLRAASAMRKLELVKD
ncbi:MAG: hypothetical protein JWL84_4188 [Rhodospirillales bacterium]|nr:hypothetical protein [Rhodospirillales bacterium]